MYKDLYNARTHARVQLLFCALNFSFGDVLVGIAVVICLSSVKKGTCFKFTLPDEKTLAQSLPNTKMLSEGKRT